MTSFLLCFSFLTFTGFSIGGRFRKIDLNSLDQLTNQQSTIQRILSGSNILNGFQLASQIPEEYDTKVRKPSVSSSQMLCPIYGTCANRCGSVNGGYTHTCNCDSQCYYFGDCCADYQSECDGNDYHGLQQATFNTKSKCELFLETFPIFMVSSCSKDFKDKSTKQLCDINLPVKCILPELLSDGKDCRETYYPQCWERLAALCTGNIDSRCPKLVENECNKWSSSVCKECDREHWPVIGSDNVLYKNSYCAACNFQQNYTTPDLKVFVNEIKTTNRSEDYPIRKCFEKVIDSCDSSSNVSDLCSSFSDPIMVNSKGKGQRKFYKNIYCAQCHNESLNYVRCASPVIIDSGSVNRDDGYFRPNLLNREIKEGHGLKLGDMPAAFSMLLNFGLDGRQKVYISSEGNDELKKHQNDCGPVHIWDPFSKKCRKLHCSTEYVLVDYVCVRRPSLDNEEPENKTFQVPDPKAQFTHLTLDAELELIDFLQFNGKEDLDEIAQDIRESFASSFNVSLDRIQNVRFNISFGPLSKEEYFKNIEDESQRITLTIDLDFYESSSPTEPEPSVISIVKLLASAVSNSGFEFGMRNITSRIFKIQQTTEFLKNWCKESDAGIMREYWNSDFKLVLNDNDTSPGGSINGLYINETGKFYPKGQFVADILYQGYQYNKNLINVSGLAITCDWRKKLNSSCPQIVLEKHEYEKLENGSLVILNRSPSKKTINTSLYEEGDNGTVLLCVSNLPEKWNSLEHKYLFIYNPAQIVVSFILLWLSIVAMILVLLTYSFFSSLRNLPGCNTMNLTLSLLAMQITYVFGQRNTVIGKACKAVAIILHFEILSCFMWMNIMAYDLFKTFGAKTILNNIRSKRTYLPRYMLYAYGVPLLMVVATSLLDTFLEESDFSPHYGDNDICWITKQPAAVAYFAAPLGIIMFVNLVFFILTILSIRNVKHVINLSQQRNKQAGKRDLCLYARMAFVIGLTWALAFAAAYVREEKVTGQILTYLFIIFNTLQGLFIFFVFVCNKRVYTLYCVSLRKIIGYVSISSNSGKTSKTFSSLANVIRRTISTDTVVSTVSNSSYCSNNSGLEIVKEEK